MKVSRPLFSFLQQIFEVHISDPLNPKTGSKSISFGNEIRILPFFYQVCTSLVGFFGLKNVL